MAEGLKPLEQLKIYGRLGQAGTIPTLAYCFRNNENPGRVDIALLQCICVTTELQQVDRIRTVWRFNKGSPRTTNEFATIAVLASFRLGFGLEKDQPQGACIRLVARNSEMGNWEPRELKREQLVI